MLEAVRGAPRTRVQIVALPTFAAALSLVIGLSIGYPTANTTLLLGVLLGIGVLALIGFFPFAGFLVLAGSVFMLVVFAATDSHYVNAFDAVLPVLLATSVLGRARRDAILADARESGGAHELIRRAGQRFASAALLYFVMAAIWLVPLARNAGLPDTLDVAFVEIRGIQGALLFPLGLWWLRSRRRIHQTLGAIFAAGVLFAIVNFSQVLQDTPVRAAITWVANHPEWPVEGPIEAGAAMVVLWALIIAYHHYRPRVWTFPMLALVLVLLFFTQSRSALLALLVFTALTMRRIRARYLIGGLLVVPIALAFAPQDFWERMVRTLTFERGTFEIYSFMVRVYGYQSAWSVFTDNWLIGVGFLGCRYVSHLHNELGITNLGAENLYLEVATGMGVLGLAVLIRWFVRLFQLGGAVRRSTPPGTLGHELAVVHTPLMAGLAVANLTATNFVGMVGIGQVALWCALLIRAGHLAVDERQPGPAAGAVRTTVPLGT